MFTKAFEDRVFRQPAVFKYHINSYLPTRTMGSVLLGNGTANPAERYSRMLAATIYSLLVPDDVIEAAIDIRKSFLKFTTGTDHFGRNTCLPDQIPGVHVSPPVHSASQIKSLR